MWMSFVMIFCWCLAIYLGLKFAIYTLKKTNNLEDEK